MVAAQATMAAQLSVDDFPLHSLHAYFLRPGRPNAEIVFDVTRAKEGKNFRARNVSAIQNNEIIFQSLFFLFQKPMAYLILEYKLLLYTLQLTPKTII